MLRLSHLLPAAACAAVLLLSAGPALADPAPVAPDSPPAGTAAPPSQGRIVNGSRATTTTAPWTAYLVSNNGTTGFACGGAIIDAVTIVTAAHCTVGVIPGADPHAGGMTASVGFSDVLSPESTLQTRTVVALRTHPQWRGDIHTSSGGDIAVLTLDRPLDLSGPAAKPIALPPPVTPGSEPLVAPQPAVITGFGTQNYDMQADHKLYTLADPVVPADVCRRVMHDSSAVKLCVQSPTGDPCSGDSGSGLVSAGPNPVLLGVQSSTTGASCQPGDASIVTSVVAPENRNFITNTPVVIAPRNLQPVTASSPANLVPGATLTCAGGGWTGSPTITWVVTNDAGTVVGTGTGLSFAYTVAPSDSGHILSCRSYASNAGGVGTSELVAASGLIPPAAAPPAPAPVAAAAPARAATFADQGVRWVNDVTVPHPPRRIRRGGKAHLQLTYGVDGGIDSTLVQATMPHNPKVDNSRRGVPAPGALTATDVLPLRISGRAKLGHQQVLLEVVERANHVTVSIHYVRFTVTITR